MSQYKTFLKQLSILELVENYEEYNNILSTQQQIYCNWISEELKERDPEAHKKWANSGEDSPRKYFIYD